MYGFNWNSMGGEYRAYSFILKGFVTTCICGSSLTFPSKITKLPQLITVLQTACFLFPIRVSVWHPEIETFRSAFEHLWLQELHLQKSRIIFHKRRMSFFWSSGFSPKFFFKELWVCWSYVLNSCFPCLWFLSSIHNFH